MAKIKQAIPINQVTAKKGIKNLRDQKFAKILYMTYVLTFPDGDVWIKQEEMVNDLAWNLQQLIASNRSTSEWKARAMALWNQNECWWKDSLGVEHLILIEEKKRPRIQLEAHKWGVSKEGFAQIKTGLTGEQVGVKDE